MLDEVDKKIDKVEQHMTTVNVRMKETLIKSTGCNFERFCVSMLCIIVLLGFVGVITEVA